MIYKAFGPEGAETVMLLHGGGLSWWNYRAEAALLADEYRVILPVLDGHAGSGRPFTTIEDCAARLLDFIDSELGGSIGLLGGLSLGAQTALEMLAQRRGLCRCALIESAMLLPSRLTQALIEPAFSSSYGLIQNRRFARLQFKSLHMREELFEDYYRDSCAIAKEDMIAFLRANAAYGMKPSLARCGARMRVVVGEKETRGVLRSAELLGREVPDCTVMVLPGLYHGEFSLNRPEDCAREICALLRA
ncbi:MAG: alpha/beta hydrolase [Oscillospiraceae bacterium]|nr:alpha/beta hydrolase [Oscillospiraceae bacterium]